MLATKLKLAAGIPLTAGAAAIVVGFALTGAANQKVSLTPTIAAATPARDEPKEQAATPSPASAKLSATGTVVDEQGRPIANARVILREWSEFRIRGLPAAEMEKLFRGAGVNDILAETSTNAAGRFRFVSVPAPDFPKVPEADQAYPWDIVALAPAGAWRGFSSRRDVQRTSITLKLGPEGIIRGRLVEPGDKPIGGAKIQVSGIDPLGRLNQNGLGTENRLNLSWSAFPLAATTGADGRFTIHGLTRDKIATIIVTEPGHERLYAFAATTDVPQPDVVSRFLPWR